MKEQFKKKMINSFRFTATKKAHNIGDREKRIKLSKSRKSILDDSQEQQFVSIMKSSIP